MADRQAATTNQANHGPPTDPDTGSSEANRRRSPPRTSASGATSILLLTEAYAKLGDEFCDHVADAKIHGIFASHGEPSGRL